MKARLFMVLLAVVAVVAARSLSAEDKPAEAKIICPVSNKEVGKDHAADFEGGKVYFCCDNCPVAFAKDTEKFGAKARHQMMVTGQIEQVHCPISHKDFKADQSTVVGGVKVNFCCGNCRGAVEKMAADEQIAKCFGKGDCFKPVKK